MAIDNDDLASSAALPSPTDLPCGSYPATVDGVYDCYSGSLLVELKPHVARDLELPDQVAAAIVPAAGGPVSGRYLLDDETIEKLRGLDIGAPASRMVRLRLPAGLPGGAGSLQAALNTLRELAPLAPETAYAELAVWGGPPMKAAALCAGSSDYLNSAPEGIGALALWNQGFDGSGVLIADVEAGWRLPHEDLDPNKIQLIYNDNNQAEAGHGTGALGILMASRNNLGGTGVAYGIDQVLLASHYERGHGCGHVPEAVYAALLKLRRGDVLLLEVQTVGKGLPVEVDSAPWQAIRDASNRGIIVVEAAGNAAMSLDKQPRLRLDSGAVMVGAALAEVDPVFASVLASSTPPGYHQWGDLSNYGSRVDCYAWGDGILTTGLPESWPNGVTPPPPEHAYRCDFNATSAAAAIVAGAAALLQSAWLKKTSGKPLSPLELRGLFKTYGTAESKLIPNHPIGVMPDLERILRDHGP